MIKKLLVIFIIKLTLISNLKNMQNHKAYVCNYPLNLCNLGSKFSVSYKIKSQLRVSLNFYSHVWECYNLHRVIRYQSGEITPTEMASLGGVITMVFAMMIKKLEP